MPPASTANPPAHANSSSQPLADAEPIAACAAAPWSYTVTVRSLCEFTAKRGDLDRRFTPSATALEGMKGQLTVAARRGQDYETEVSLEGNWAGLHVRGRADGYDPRRRCLEEVKTIRGRPDDIPENRRHLHWAQLQTYGALFCRQRAVAELALALVYFDVESQSETELRQVCSAEELEAAFDHRCKLFSDWARQEARHRLARDAGLRSLPFPQGEFRSGQRSLAEAVYRATVNGRCLLAQAPTGIGKTLGTLFPMLRAMPEQGIDKIAYLTCKGTGRVTALDALEGLRNGTAGQALRVVAMVPKKQACEHPDKACHGDACPLARGFYDRLAAARADAVAHGWLDAGEQRQIALRHGVCPYYLGQELVRWADVVVGDVHHGFDPNGQLWGLMQAMDWKLGVLVDEAHNLVDRARQMYSAEMRLTELRDARRNAPATVRSSLDALIEAFGHLIEGQVDAYAVLDEVSDEFVQTLQAAAAALGEHFQRQPLSVGPLLNFNFALQRFLKLVDSLADHSLFYVQRDTKTWAPTVPATSIPLGMPLEEAASDLFEASDDAIVDTAPGADAAPERRCIHDATFTVRNVVPARFLRQRFKAMHAVTLFSATLGPPDYPINLLGLPEDTAWIDVPPAFPPENLTVRVAHGVSTRYMHRTRSLDTLVDVMSRQFDERPGNHLAFFSSFEYLQRAADALALRRPDIALWRQDRRMAADARRVFLAQFRPDGAGIGFAVLGGVFAEGIDLPGTRLIGAFIATLGLPPISPVQDQIQARLDKLFGAEHGYADLVPAMQKVIQAAGRILRTPEDRGTLWLLDDRYTRDAVRCLLPASWGLQQAGADASAVPISATQRYPSTRVPAAQ